jgi:DNA-binding response OmpR family regulator
MPKTHKILIIDDDAELCEALKEQLSLYEEFNAIVARTASEGIQTVRAGVIDLVIMDIGTCQTSRATRLYASYAGMVSKRQSSC